MSRILKAPARVFPLSPSDFAFGWDDCRCCQYRKIVLKERRPRMPFPKVFGMIDTAMKGFYLGERAEAIAPGLPAGVIGGANRWVKSEVIVPPGCSTGCFIRGRVDVLVEADDATVGVLDFKTSGPREDHVAVYGRQLHGYGYALEHPANGRPVTVSSLGLLCFLPETYQAQSPAAALYGALKWIEVERDDDAFLAFLAEVVSVLSQPEPPAPSPDCGWCAWRNQAAS